jgi:Uma2 family endonuclease
MTTVLHPPRHSDDALFPLEPGDHLDQETFHRLYERMPPGIKCELVGGVVYMPSPVKFEHGAHSTEIITWLGNYKAATPGVVALDNATVILGEDAEPQPDACLLIEPRLGGQTRITDDGSIHGAPELVVEIGASTVSQDLHQKKADYQRYGVGEYLVILVRQRAVRWFAKTGAGFQELSPGEDGLFRSRVFPGLWLNPAALLARDSRAVRATLEEGLAADEHRRFAADLAARGR